MMGYTAIHSEHLIKIHNNMKKIYSLYAFLPARASEQGNVIGSVRIYIYVQKKIVIERTRDLIYLKFVATASVLAKTLVT